MMRSQSLFPVDSVGYVYAVIYLLWSVQGLSGEKGEMKFRSFDVESMQFEPDTVDYQLKAISKRFLWFQMYREGKLIQRALCSQWLICTPNNENVGL